MRLANVLEDHFQQQLSIKDAVLYIFNIAISTGFLFITE